MISFPATQVSEIFTKMLHFLFKRIASLLFAVSVGTWLEMNSGSPRFYCVLNEVPSIGQDNAGYQVLSY